MELRTSVSWMWGLTLASLLALLTGCSPPPSPDPAPTGAGKKYRLPEPDAAWQPRGDRLLQPLPAVVQVNTPSQLAIGTEEFV